MVERSEQDNIENASASGVIGTEHIKGFLDTIRPGFVSGWAWNKEAPDQRLEIEIMLGKTSLGRTRADRMRPDLEANGIGDGKYGFRFVVEDPLNDTDQDSLVAVARRTPSDEPVRVPGVMQPEGLAHLLIESQRKFSTSVASIHRGQAEALDAQKSTLKLHEEIVTLLRSGRGERDAEERKLRELLEGLDQRLATLEVVQTRVDWVVLNLSKPVDDVATPGKGVLRWLTAIAVLLAMGVGGVLGYFLKLKL